MAFSAPTGTSPRQPRPSRARARAPGQPDEGALNATVPSRIMGHPSDGGSVGLSHPQAARTDNPKEPFQPLAPSKQATVQPLYSVSVTLPIGAGRNGERSTPTRRRDTQYLPVSALPEWPGGSPGGRI